MPELPDFSDPLIFLLTIAAVLLIITARYFLVAGLFHLVFYSWQHKKWKPYKINRETDSRQYRKEIKNSLVSGLIFSIITAVTLFFWQKGYTRVYYNINQYTLAWLPGSFLLSLVVQEVYYYWVHRWMHFPKIFRLIHKTHHESRIPSPWTAFSFHPLEALALALVLPAIIFIIPMHPWVILIQLVFMTVSSVINHLDIEIYPAWFQKSFLGKLFIGATHHSAHHKQYKYNYGLYFTVFDKLHNTESPGYSGKY
jgi:Delta7-sterol 5-desaturase